MPDPNQQGQNDYISQLRRKEKSPESSYEHGDKLLQGGVRKNPSEIYALIDEHIKLANVENDELLRLYQAESHSLAHLASMSLDDEDLHAAFDFFYSCFRAELGLTRAHKGFERRMQDSFGRGQGETSGYGAQLDDIGFGGGQQPGQGGGGMEGFKKFMPSMPQPNKRMFMD